MIIQPILVIVSILVVVTGILAAVGISLGSYEEKEININDKIPTKGSGQSTTCSANPKTSNPSACGRKATCCKNVNV
jgi:hypothetical protein